MTTTVKPRLSTTRLQEAREHVGFAMDELRLALADATALEAETIYAALAETVNVRRRAALIIDSRAREEKTT